jgi:hypothetical protein
VRRLVVLAVVAGALWAAPGALAAGWCGSGEQAADRADLVTGRQIHAVVAVPADGPDTFATTSGRIADDVASISAWWTGQDPTRVPRFDLAAFGSATCLDISFLRLPQTGAAFTDADAAFSGIVGDLRSAGFDSPYKDYLVYYDGPTPQQDVCGVGAGQFDSGPGIAVVIPPACPGVPTDTIAAHELLHALGALPPGAPNACPNDPGHPCDSPADVLYPYTGGEPLSQKVLDVNHDDYYAHSGSWPDIQDSLWLRHLDAPQEALALAIQGGGTVISDVPGVDCTVSCTTQWDQGSSVSLTPQPAAGQRFVSWKGACSGTDFCALILDAPKAATAVFGPLRVPVVVRTAGKGRVACTPGCSKSFPAGSALTLRAVAAPGWRFVSWSGACKGTHAVCRPATDFAVAAKATFRRRNA